MSGRKRPPCCEAGGSGPTNRRRVINLSSVVAPPPPRNVHEGQGPWELANGLVVRRCPDNSDDAYTHYRVQVRDLRDLVTLGDFLTTAPHANNLNAATLQRLHDPLQRLLDMVGLEDVKRSIFELVLYHMQRLHVGGGGGGGGGGGNESGDMVHTAVFGAPGVGKTMLIGVLADVYAALGIVRGDGPVVHARRADLIGQYLGQTAIKTRDVIASAHGGILVIDEAYSIGQEEGGRDIYAAECVNTLNQALTEQRADFVCIIAGYKESIERLFFRMNPGLERRFTLRFHLPDHDAASLARIFRAKVFAAGWTLESADVGAEAFWLENKRYFSFNGGDVEAVFARVKMAHAVRVFSMPRREKRRVSQADFDAGFDAFRALDNVKRRGEDEDFSHRMMYM